MVDETQSETVPAEHGRFYTGFVGTLKWSVIVIAMLLIALAIFLVR